MGKAFNSIINLRLERIMEERGISNDLQIGFEPDHQIADHILVLNTLIDQSKACKKGM